MKDEKQEAGVRGKRQTYHYSSDLDLILTTDS